MNKYYSIYRNQEYKKISDLTIEGRILDLGGSKKSGYHELIKGSHAITTANINKDFGCDIIFDMQEDFPLADEAYDAVICFSVFEHVFNFSKGFSETNRVLKKGGRFIFAVPFMYQVHGSPDDYFRYTKSAIKELLKNNNFSEFNIEELGFGLASLNFQIMGGFFPAFMRSALSKICVGFDKLLSLSSKYRKFSKRIPLGYFVVAQK